MQDANPAVRAAAAWGGCAAWWHLFISGTNAPILVQKSDAKMLTLIFLKKNLYIAVLYEQMSCLGWMDKSYPGSGEFARGKNTHQNGKLCELGKSGLKNSCLLVVLTRLMLEL